MAERLKITYTTLSAKDPALHAEMDAALARVRSRLGETFPMWIGGKESVADQTFPIVSPIDAREPVAYFQSGTREDAKAAIAAAKAAFPAWRDTPWEDRCKLVDAVADRIDDNIFDLSAMMMLEMGKSRMEALGEVAETSALLRYYAQSMRDHNGYITELLSFGPTDFNASVLKPYGVWAIISPFNFPMALAAAPVSAALVTGNTVILKPSSDAPWTTYEMARYYVDEGVPAGVLNYITGRGSTAGAELVENPDVAGITFTGSYEVGFENVYRSFATHYPKPVIVEMGGKNPTIVSDKADIDKASLGVMRSAFGLNGQKCSACSRAYVHENVYDEFIKALIAKTEAIKVDDPTLQDTFMGPVANKSQYEDYQRFMDKARSDGTVLFGGNPLTTGEMAHGYYVEPAIIAGLPHEHELVQNELFLPILFVEKVSSVDEGMAKSNDVIYGLTAGFFSEDEKESQWFLDNIQAGTIYVNRPGGATTGAWPGYQAFGGWKSSGSSGRGIGAPYSLLNYLREQSQTVIREGMG